MADTGSPDGQRPTAGARVGALLEDAGQFVARHAEVVAEEARTSARRALVGVLLVAGGAAVLAFALVLLLVAAILALAALTHLPTWAATLIVTAVAVALAGGLVWAALRQFRGIGFPTTRRVLAEDREWLAGITRKS